MTRDAHPAWFSAPGKLLLFGEHAAVYGYPALGTELTQQLHIRVRERAGTDPTATDELCFLLPDGRREFMPEFARHLQARLAERGVERYPAEIELASELPVSSGFGSSAAVCTAVARWALPGATTPAIWQLAHELEQAFHGTPSGIDTGIASWGGTCAFHFRKAGTLPEVTQLPGALPYLVFGSIPRERSTAELVAGVRALRERDPELVTPLLDRLGELAQATIRALSAASPGAEPLGEAATEAQRLLQQLGVSSPALEELLARGRAAGASGGKLSGAGGGGAFFLVAKDAGSATALSAALEPLLPGSARLMIRSPGGAETTPTQTWKRR